MEFTGIKRLKGYQTYIAIVAVIVYEAAIARKWVDPIPEVRLGLWGSVLAFLRAGSKRDATKAVQAIKEDPSAELPRA